LLCDSFTMLKNFFKTNAPTKTSNISKVRIKKYTLFLFTTFHFLQSHAAPSYAPKKELVVAIIDTGLDIKNEFFAYKIWINNGEVGLDNQGKDKRFNNVDDDQNGFIDDVHGWNFADKSPDIIDENGHGTHVGALILGFNLNDSARASINKINLREAIPGNDINLRIMILKYHNSKTPSENTIKFSTQAIKYAVQMGADIINFSGGGFGFDEDEASAIHLAFTKGILLFCASGNENVNTDRIGFYPASYKFENIVSVGAIDESNNFLKSSNFGKKTVHILAYGNNVQSYGLESKITKMSGTSQATAIATNHFIKSYLNFKYSASITTLDYKNMFLNKLQMKEIGNYQKKFYGPVISKVSGL
jgi:thermitase